MIKQFQHLLLRFGILSRISKKVCCATNTVDKIKRDYYVLNITDSDSKKVFRDEIGFFLDYKQNKICVSEITNTNVDIVPLPFDRVRANQPYRDIKGRFKSNVHEMTSFDKIPFRIHSNRFMSRKTLLRLAEYRKDEELYNFAKSDIFWDEVVSLDFLEGEFKVWDIEVDNSEHNFVVNDIIVHNSYTTRKSLKNLGIQYECIEAYVTPPELFLALYRCRQKGKILVCDDCHKLLEDPRCLSYLKSALASTEELNKGRVVTNATQKPLQDPISGQYVPNSFFFDGSVIILTNSLNDKSAHIKAVLSRLDRVRLSLSEEQKFKIMHEIIKTSYSSLTVDERDYCLQYLQDNSGICPKYLINLRTLKKLFDYYLFCKSKGSFDSTSFDVMGRGLLETDNDGVDDADLVCVQELEKHGELNREEKCEEFIKLQNKSRATYFRVLERTKI